MKNTNVIMSRELAEKELNTVCAGGGTVRGKTPSEKEKREREESLKSIL